MNQRRRTTAIGLNKRQFREVARALKPELRNAEFDAMWADYCAARRAHLREVREASCF